MHHVTSSVAQVTTRRRAWVPPLDRTAFRDGVGEMSVLWVAIAIWGLVTGVAMANVLPTGWALTISLSAYAGSAQIAALPLLADRIPLPIVLATVLIVNLRFAIFGAAARPYFQALSRRQRLLAGFLNGDLGSAMFLRRYGAAPVIGTPEQWGYFYGFGLANYVAWHVSSVIGILLGGAAPTDWGLELAATLALVAVIIPMLTRMPALVGALVAGSLAIGLHGLPMKLGLLVGVVVGVAAALAAENLSPAEASETPDEHTPEVSSGATPGTSRSPPCASSSRRSPRDRACGCCPPRSSCPRWYSGRCATPPPARWPASSVRPCCCRAIASTSVGRTTPCSAPSPARSCSCAPAACWR
jgi:predicted branched-subunit amino acid permease